MRGGRAEQHAVRHDDRRAPANLEQPQEQREKQQFGLFGLDDLLQILRRRLVIERAGEGRIGEEQAVAVLLARNILGRANREPRSPDSRCRARSCSSSRCAAWSDRNRSREMRLVEMRPQFRIAQHSGCFSRKNSPAATRKPQVPQAGSQIASPGFGSVSSTISLMIWRGVRNWPFCPALAILPSMYS